jgi:hypothetical protein
MRFPGDSEDATPRILSPRACFLPGIRASGIRNACRFGGEFMNRRLRLVALMVALAPLLHGQLGRIVIPAGTPEDKVLQAISNEQDAQKKLTMYQDFLQQFSSNVAAVAYGNWQISQFYQSAGDLKKALEYGDKALAGSANNLDILTSQAGIAQQLKDNAKVLDYAARGGAVFNSIGQQPKPAAMSDQDFASSKESDINAAKPSYEFLEAAAFNAIAGESDAKTRLSYIERYTPAFPKSRFEEQVTSYAMMALSELKDSAGLLAYGEKSLAANPDSIATLLLLANAYADDLQPGSLGKAVSYSQKVISLAKADAADADRSRKLSAGAAHSTLGYAFLKQNKTEAALPELKSATALLKGEDDQSYAVAGYRLGIAYTRVNQMSEARQVLTEVSKIEGPVRPLAQGLLTKMDRAAAKTKK